MARPLLTNTAVRMPQEEPHGATPAPLEAPAVLPGTGLPKADPVRSRGPMPAPTNPQDNAIPVPKPPGPGGAIPVPKPRPRIFEGEVPMPKPQFGPIVGGEPLLGVRDAIPRPKPPGPGTTPSVPGVTPGTYSSVGGGIDFRGGVAATDRDAVNRTVTDDELTSKQLSRLIDENGRFIQGARLRAREGAADSGMLLSSVAAGSAERAAIEAAAPIAQADAGVYATTASENMRATNEDRLADQMAGRSLLSQSESQIFQGNESAAGRNFQSAENRENRAFQREESSTERDWRSMEAGRDRDLQFLMQERGFSFQDAQAAVERGWRSNEATRERDFSGGQNERQRQQQRISDYNNLMANREAQLSAQLSAIFGNTNLKPEEQARAAANARAVFTSTAASFNAAFAQGVPTIFFTPYEMRQPTTPAPGTPAPPPGPTPVPGTPPGGSGGSGGGSDAGLNRPR